VDEVTSKAIEIALIDLERVENSTTGETRKRVVWVIDGLRALFRQPTQPVVPEGYVLVPVEPTEKMIKAGFGYDPDENCTYRLHPAQAYRAMLSAGKGGE
jgi:hypothetical protein